MNGTAAPRSRSHWAIARRRLLRRKSAVCCGGIIVVFTALALLDFVSVAPLTELADWSARIRRDGWIGLTSHHYTTKTLIDVLFDPGKEDTYVAPLSRVGSPTKTFDAEGKPILVKHFHWLGTDVHGDDVLHKTIKGCNTALIIGGFTTLIVIPIAVFFGMLAGYFGGWIDDAIQYIYSTLASVPGILLLVGLMTVLGKGLPQLCIALGITSWVGLCRLVRGEVLKQRELDYVLAERALGAGAVRIMMRHILPNIMPLIIIATTLRFSGLVLSESVLSYIGIGVAIGTASWGSMIADAQNELMRMPPIWWNLAAAGGALFIVVLAFNIFGDALRDALDPRVGGD